MTKNDLKFGDIVITRNGKKWIVIKDDLRNENDEFLNFNAIDEDLKNTGAISSHWDIMKVQRYKKCYPKAKVEFANSDVKEEMELLGDSPYTYTLETIYERKDEILNEKEKEYLRAVIRPFRNRVESFYKNCFFDEEQIWISMDNWVIKLPFFKKNTMYKGMEIDKEYSLEDLNI